MGLCVLLVHCIRSYSAYQYSTHGALVVYYSDVKEKCCLGADSAVEVFAGVCISLYCLVAPFTVYTVLHSISQEWISGIDNVIVVVASTVQLDPIQSDSYLQPSPILRNQVLINLLFSDKSDTSKP